MVRCYCSLLAILVSFTGIGHADPDQRLDLGINLTGVVDWSTEQPFVDVFKHSREWISQQQGQAWGKGPKLELTAEGWVKRLQPGQYATTLTCLCDGHYPAGKYVCLYEGEGELDFQADAKIVERSAGRITLQVTPRDGIHPHLRQTNPENPVRNIRLLMPGHVDTYEREPFVPTFLERYRPFKVIRFMDWMKTNDSKIAKWSDRPVPADARQSSKGVALELMIDLANRLKVDPWFCMPHLADDDYVRRFAGLVREKLDPALRIYVEHSNEVWNSQFGQARYAAEQGRKLGLSNNAYQAQLFYHSYRSVAIFKIWEEVFGGTDRLVRVLGSQSANPWVSEQVMTYKDAHKHADALGIAPYFGHSLGSPRTADQVAEYSVDRVIEVCRKQIGENRAKIAAVVEQAKTLGLEVVAYEAGQHLVGHGGAENNDRLTKLFHAVNRDRRMHELYVEDMKSWRDAGGGLYVVFSSVSRPSKWGSWGLLEFDDQDPATAPKYQAVREFLKQTEK